MKRTTKQKLINDFAAFIERYPGAKLSRAQKWFLAQRKKGVGIGLLWGIDLARGKDKSVTVRIPKEDL